MCGIVGVFSKNKIKLSSIQSMNDSIVHRGPDDEGYLSGGDNINDTVLNKLVTIDTDVNMVFGHRRLAIQDLSEYGHQPMLYLERYWIVYNGEIYNFHELKKSLEVDGYFFVSNSDTEVIMAAYDKWGASCLERFNGMWAFVIYDSHKKKVFISRDRFGIKPLYYYQDENNFVFASEIKALLHYPNVSCEPDLGYCKLFLKEGPKEYIKNTAFKNIFRFKKASFLECDLNTIFSNFKENRFWEVSVNLSSEKFDSGKAKKYAEKYYGLLKSSVELRLRADVKVGSALSGGLDSSSIVYLINQQLSEVGDGDKQETFSSVYLDENTEHCDESFFIDEITNNLDVSSNRIEPNIDEIIDCHKKYIYHLDTPAANTLMSNWYTYKLTNQKNIKISLDGQGADEQIAGYFRYLTHIVFESSILSIIKLVYSSRKINGAKSYIFRGLMLKILNIFNESIVSIIFKNRNSEYTKRAFKKTNEVMAMDFDLNLEAFFNYADKGSMAFSIESRMPFMDYRIVEYLASIPISYKFHNGWTKFLAREAFAGRLPASITWRKDKMGWPIPEEYWFKGKLSGVFKDTIVSSKILNMLNASVNKDVDIFEQYSFDYLMRCYNLTLWHSIFFEGDAP